MAVILLYALPSVALAGYRIASWVPDWTTNSLTSTQANASRMTESNPTWFTFNSDGTLSRNAAATDPVWRAAMTGTELLPTIQNTTASGFDKNLVVSMLGSVFNRERHAEEITQQVISQAYDGIDIDYEKIPATSKANFTAFIQLLSTKLHAAGKKLSVTVYAKESDSATWDGPGGEDYIALGAAADWVKIMTYDYSYDGSAPGPITPLDWLDRCITYAEARIPPAKILVGMPWYGYEWTGTAARGLSYRKAMDGALLNNATISYDPNGEATYKYSNKTVFFIDAYSYGRKVDLILQKHPGVAGFAHWCNGYEDPAVWTRVEALKNGTTPLPAPPLAPTSLLASSASVSAATLTWMDASNDEQGFRVERCIGDAVSCTASGASFSQIAQTAANISSLADAGLSAATSYTYRVRSFNAFGVSGFSNLSAARTLSVAGPPPSGPTVLIPVGSTWRYRDDGSDQASAWRAIGFNDAAWLSGASQLGYGEGDERTVIGYGSSATNKFVTTYFRQGFNISDPAAFTALSLRMMRDDGAVVYINGIEAARSNMPAGPILYRTFASGSISVDESAFHSFSLTPQLLVSGMNVIAVEIHQSDPGSSDVSFDLELSGTISSSPAIPAPSNLTASSSSPARIDLLWTDNSTTETGFRLERCTGLKSVCDGAPSGFLLVSQTSAGATTFSDLTVLAKTSYTYRVRAFDSVGSSAWSTSSSATTPAPPPPAAPSNLAATSVSSSQINLTWSDLSNNETGFRIERCTGSLAVCNAPTASYAQIAQTAANIGTWSDAGLAGSATYSYRIASFHAEGTSAWSAPAAGTTTAAPPPPPPLPGPVSLISTGSSWKYLDNGTDQGAGWLSPTFSDSTWKTGLSQFGYGDGDEKTVISYGSSKSKYVTTYFRKTFEVSNPSALTSLTIRVMRDDGAVVYLNGTEVWRSNMPSGLIGYRTFALTAVVPPDESTFFERAIPSALLTAGTNVLSVEIHQSDASSSDVSFDLELIGR